MRDMGDPRYVLRQQGTLDDEPEEDTGRLPGNSPEDPSGSEILLERARVVFAAAQSDSRSNQHIAEVDQLVDVAKRMGEVSVVGQLLRYAVVVRLAVDGGEQATREPLAEFEAYCRRNGLLVLLSDAGALRAKVALGSGHEDTAISEIARALAVLDDVDAAEEVRSPHAVLGTVLVDISVVLMALGVFEIADQIMRRAQKVAEATNDTHLEVVLNSNRIFLLLEWGRRLERLNFPDTARQNFVKASMLAKQTEQVFLSSRFPVDPDRPVADQHQALAVAHAYANPGRHHYARLGDRLERATAPHDKIDVALPLARCMEREGEYARATELLSSVVASTAGVRMLFPLLRVSLYRELARMTELAENAQRTGAVQDYIHQLELELWQLRETRMVTLNTRREHERLAREHGAVSAQAMQDPLTELPNRRALTERLLAMSDDARCFPLAIALIDLDGFKLVNDRYSHGRGDEVLRAIANTLREVLRGDDLVARYGGDEFVAVLGGAPLHAAHAALGRAVAAVDRLPEEVTRGVTLSVGVVSMTRTETEAGVLARADAAMYEAKRRGGNTVVVLDGTGDEGVTAGP